MFLFNLSELESLDEFEKVPDIEVPIEGAVNLKSKPMGQYKVKLAYGELTLIVAILRDYVKSFDKLKEEGNLPLNELEYECYYRKKFMDMANRISEQIEYDYDKQKMKCEKKLNKQDNSDIGADAMELAISRQKGELKWITTQQKQY